MDDIMLSGIVLMGMVLISGMEAEAVGVMAIEDSAAAPQRVLANA